LIENSLKNPFDEFLFKSSGGKEEAEKLIFDMMIFNLEHFKKYVSENCATLEETDEVHSLN